MIEKYYNKNSSHRLSGYDYSGDGYYFITIKTHRNINYFGTILNKKVILTEIGRIAKKYWKEIPKHYPFVKIDYFVIMPDHIHGIIKINKGVTIKNVAAQNLAQLPVWLRKKHNYKNVFGPQSKNLSSIIRGYKIATKKWATMNNINFYWQRSFHDRIIRNEKELDNVYSE